MRAAAVVTADMPPPAGVRTVRLRVATVTDADAIHALILGHLLEGHLLPREREEIASHAQRFVVAVQDGHVVGCAELAPLSRTVSEVRSLVVSPEVRGIGLASEIIDDLVERATASGIGKLCAFTHAPAPFVRLGFSIVPHVWLPEKIVTDCHSCALFRRCGQYAVLRELRRSHDAAVAPTTLHG